MIPLEPEHFFSVYVTFWFFLLGFLWFCEIRRQRRVTADWSAEKQRLYLCGRCRLSFLAKPGQSVMRCPRCNEMCFLPRRKRF